MLKVLVEEISLTNRTDLWKLKNQLIAFGEKLKGHPELYQEYIRIMVGPDQGTMDRGPDSGG